jgi:YHS domain-containing protein
MSNLEPDSRYIFCAFCNTPLYCFETDLMENPDAFWLNYSKRRYYFCNSNCLNEFVLDNYKQITPFEDKGEPG